MRTVTASPTRTTILLWGVLGLLLAGVVAVAVQKVWPILYPPLLQVTEPDPDCDLRAGPCTARFPDGRAVSFAITPPAIPIATPLRLVVEASGFATTAVEVDFVGVDMNMGFNRVTLREVRSGRYEGQGMLPVCARARMIWEARVLLHTPEGILAAPFRFATERH
ncbi:hypothetical protein [Thiocystis violascens]|uniref:Uncharacterized protein n=1 Tax=Thiocystis violascens (strain ATCC 17096 / DSM 198 / 6111) TaxID=765911 RepID=I3Y883_THIV6|nr:hypothetical protein [Thiocystis violascens]AFL73201.1 hypothetical protein Thivi_1171 [Thiocystis violascens DSM 198]